MNPGPLTYQTEHCSIARALALVGEKWTFLVLREAFNGVRRFDDILTRTGAPRQVLSNRLVQLVDAGLLRRAPYQEPGQRQRYEYRLTAMGLDLYPVLVSLLTWGDRYLAAGAGPPLLLTHRDCGEQVSVALHCAAGHRLESAREVRPVAGPGASSVTTWRTG
ncbi:MAG: winged helix-turn-helix transcriptional regulator [Micromonosporaceae bacterium]